MAEANRTAHGPLHGVRVLEFTMILAGPIAGGHLADLGAEVVKVEPPGGDPFRSQGAIVPEHGKSFQVVNRGKRSVVLDLKRPEARDIVYRLLPAFDAVLINYRAGVATQLGIDYETLSKLKQDLIYAEIGGFDPDGPWAGKPGTDMVAQAYGGTVAHDGKLDENGAPVWPAMTIGDTGAALATTVGLLSALYHRKCTGEGQYLSASLMRAVLQMIPQHVSVEPIQDAHNRDLMAAELKRVRVAGGSYRDLMEARLEPRRRGSPLAIYFRGYQAADGGLMLGAITKANRDAVRMALGVEDDPTDGDDWNVFDPGSVEVVEDITERVAALIRQRPVAEWVEIIEAAGAPVAPVLFPEEVADHEEGRRHFVELEHEVTGPQRFVGPIVQLARTPTAIRGPAPLLGADGDSLLAALGGYAEEEITALRESGALG